jgi:Tol biopolymer transport system component
MSFGLFAQLNQDEIFGKNRVQYHKDFKYWWKYETPNFITYWYSPARKVAESAILYAEEDYQEIQNLLEHHINDKIQIIVFKDLTDFKQSNLGSDEIFEIQAGQTKIEGNRIFIYSKGDHNDLRHQIREGIASVHIAQMLQGSTIQEIVQNAFLASLPQWYITGLISYVGTPFEYEFENDLRTYFTENENRDFEYFAREFPTLAGHAMWNYIYTKYGPTNLSNLLYITRINRRLDNGFIYVLGVPLEQVSRECYEFYKNNYEIQERYFSDPEYDEIKIKKKRISKRRKGLYNLHVTDIELSPDKKSLVYVTNELGKYRVWQVDTKTKKQKKLMQGSFRNPFQEADHAYPMLSWGASSNELYGVYEKRDKLYLNYWDFREGESFEQELPPEIQRIYSLNIWSPDTLLISASTDGYTDLYFYRPKTRQTYRLTNDYFDDVDAVTIRIGQSRYIVFSSNRINTSLEKQSLDTILPNEECDLFLLSPQSNIMQRLTNTDWASEREPQIMGTEVHYISDENGILNRWVMDVAGDKIKPEMLTTYKTGINHFSMAADQIVESVRKNNDPSIRIVEANSDQKREIHYTALAKLKRELHSQVEIPAAIVSPQEKKDVRNYYFQSEYKEEIPLPPEFNEVTQVKDESLLILPDFSDLIEDNGQLDRRQKFNSAKMLAYRLTFGLTDFDIDINNDLLFTGLNSFAGYKRGFEYPEAGIFLRTESRDLFENYIVSGGARVPLTFNGTEFYLAIEDRKYQLDKKLSIYRKSNKERQDRRFDDLPDTRNTTHIGVLQLNYPFSIFSSVRLLTTLRFDRTVFLPDEVSELNRADMNQQRIGLRLEYVFDNTYQSRLNILNGTRAKVYVEATNRFQVQFDPWTFNLSKAFMTTIGVDLRHYFRLDRFSIFATRFAGATSFGSERILYYLGGVRNWIAPQYNNSIPFPESNDFAFQAAGNDMRGFKQNIRNGSTYMLGNAELRIPFFNYFTKRDIKSKFFRNFQIVGFADVGTAWHGSSPTSDENSLNTEFISNAASNVKITYFRDPLVFGYGAGVRLNLLGYFVRLDYAWGFETRKRTDPIFYLSLGYDF